MDRPSLAQPGVRQWLTWTGNGSPRMLAFAVSGTRTARRGLEAMALLLEERSIITPEGASCKALFLILYNKINML